MPTKVSLIIPVENQVRELDPKLLLGCIAARRGFPVYIGSRREIHFHIPAFPRGIYLSKSMTGASDLMFRIMRSLGHQIVAWDEEALVHLPDEIYYSRRLSPGAMAHVSNFFAWGEDNAELWRRYPQMPAGAAIHVTGNPRNDLLRPEMHAYYEAEVAKIRAAHGNFFLVNTNFNHVNGFTPVQNLFQPSAGDGAPPPFGRAAKGMTRDYAEGLRDLKEAVFTDFQEMIPRLDRVFPDHNIVVRPHPTENPEVYQAIAQRCQRVIVTNAGNVVPWLLAAQAVIHNGCTTGVEAYVMRVPAITYRASISEAYDFGFYRLPNSVSQPCFNFDELQSTLRQIAEGTFNPDESAERRQIVAHCLAAVEGPLACERMVDVLEQMAREPNGRNRPGMGERLKGWLLWAGRTRVKRYKDSRPGSHNRPEFQKHRYPDVAIEDIRDRIARFEKLLGPGLDLRAEKWLQQFFRINAKRNTV
jgi:surface carbohydrate biosynthesis protein